MTFQPVGDTEIVLDSLTFAPSSTEPTVSGDPHRLCVLNPAAMGASAGLPWPEILGVSIGGESRSRVGSQRLERIDHGLSHSEDRDAGAACDEFVVARAHPGS